MSETAAAVANPDETVVVQVKMTRAERTELRKLALDKGLPANEWLRQVFKRELKAYDRL